MEIIFLLISVIVAVIIIYLIGMGVHNSHSKLIRALKDEDLLLFMIFMSIMLSLIFFITLCAFNNTFWHLPYYFK